jgi:hypothetical protein
VVVRQSAKLSGEGKMMEIRRLLIVSSSPSQSKIRSALGHFRTS